MKATKLISFTYTVERVDLAKRLAYLQTPALSLSAYIRQLVNTGLELELKRMATKNDSTYKNEHSI